MKRKSNLELLRMFSMLLIIMHHFAVHGTYRHDEFMRNYFSSELLINSMQSLGKLGVNLFVFISAYFLVDKKFKFSRVISVALITMFYTISIYLCVYGYSVDVPNYIKINILTSLFPFPSITNYWFVDSYIFMLFLMPYMNVIIHKVSKKKLKLLIIVLSVFWVIIPQLNSYFPGKPDFWISSFGLSDGILFLYIYILAGYVKLYPNKITQNLGLNILFSLILLVILFISIYLPMRLSFSNQNMYGFSLIMGSSNSILVVLLTITIFCVFLNLDIGSINFINYIAGSTFAVYLIHDNSLIRPILWNYINNDQFKASKYQLFIAGISNTIMIYCVCVLIDLVRRICFEKLFNKISFKLGDLLDNKIGSYFSE